MKEGGRTFWSTLLIVFVLLVHNGTTPLFLIAYSLLPLLIFLFYRKQNLYPLVFYLLAFGTLARWERYFRQGYMSDVLLVTHDFIGYLFNGHSPYRQMVFSAKGLTPFIYLPFELFWYMPAQVLNVDLRFFEMLISCLIPIAVFLISRLQKNWSILPGLAVVSLTPFLLDLASDGSNDNSATFLLLLSVLLFILGKKKKSQKISLASAVILGCALAFKHYVAFYFLFLIPYLLPQKKYLKIVLLTAGLLIIPFFLTNPNGFANAQLYIENRPGHEIWGWNLWEGIKPWLVVSQPIMKLTRLIITLVTVIINWRLLKFKLISQVFAAASLTLLVYLILSPWASPAYFTFLIPLFVLALPKYTKA